MSRLITVQDKCSSGTFSSASLAAFVWALGHQALYQYNRSPWVEHGYAQAISGVQLLGSGAAVPPGAWNIELVDQCSAAGALGFHEDYLMSSAHSIRGMSSNETPFSQVGVHTSRQAGVKASEVASHEMLEMIVDPYVVDEAVVRRVLNKSMKEWYIVEVGDPVQEHGYDVGAPDGHKTGWVVSDFAWPRWFGMAQTRPDMSFRDSVKTAFEIAPGGYMSVAPEGEPTNWQQIFGERTPHVPNPQ